MCTSFRSHSVRATLIFKSEGGILEGCGQRRRIYVGFANKGLSTVLKDTRYVFVGASNKDLALLHAPDAPHLIEIEFPAGLYWNEFCELQQSS